MNSSVSELFELGVADYFRNFGHRDARESPHQAWLLMSVAKYISPQLLVAELQVANQDLRPFGKLKDTSGSVNFDFAVTRSEINLRSWKSQTKGWKQGNPTNSQTLATLQQTDVLAELKIANSSSSTADKLVHDLVKLSCAMQFLNFNSCDQFPACYFIILDPDRRPAVSRAVDKARSNWPESVPFPKVLIGPRPEGSS